MVSQPAAAQFGVATACASRALLARYVEIGEDGQLLRDSDALAQAALGILNLPLGKEVLFAGHFYDGLFHNRRGDGARANKIFLEVAAGASPLFRTKACIALGSNLCNSGDFGLAGEVYREARKILSSSGHHSLHLEFLIELQQAAVRFYRGAAAGAAADLERVRPLAIKVGELRPALLCTYFNNLAVFLGESRRLEEARSCCQIIMASPLLGRHPEWQKTCADLLAPTGSSSRTSMLVDLWCSEQNPDTAVLTCPANFADESHDSECQSVQLGVALPGLEPLACESAASPDAVHSAPVVASVTVPP
ncbi:MAG TPA: hypothetical protein VI756_13720, partial [Blastocatellia bacterium]